MGEKEQDFGTIGEKNPKTLMTINKKPIISYIIDNLINNGCNSINISGYHNYKKLNSYIRKLNSKNIRCRNDGDISILERVKKYLIEKASILINGVSLTISKVTKNGFQIWAIPHTLKLTNLKDLKKNDIVNIEIDILSKYIKKFFNEKK